MTMKVSPTKKYDPRKICTSMMYEGHKLFDID